MQTKTQRLCIIIHELWMVVHPVTRFLFSYSAALPPAATRSTMWSVCWRPSSSIASRMPPCRCGTSSRTAPTTGDSPPTSPTTWTIRSSPRRACAPSGLLWAPLPYVFGAMVYGFGLHVSIMYRFLHIETFCLIELSLIWQIPFGQFFLTKRNQFGNVLITIFTSFCRLHLF